jgi:predicted SAM-dependent methyltransferase
MNPSTILDVGCGNQKHPGAIGIDFNADTQADIVHNLNQYPYPFADNRFERIYVTHCIEHLEDVVKVMEELHRISRPGARITIDAPYFSGQDAFSDPTHRHFFTSRSLDYFTGDFPEYGFYSKKARYKKIAYQIDFWKIHKLGGIRLQNYLGLGFLANRLTGLYEKFFAFIFPAQSIRYELEVVK